MVISLEDAVAILDKWKDESAHIVVAAESPFQQTLRGIHGRGVRWVTNQSVKVSRVSFFLDKTGSKQGIVELIGPAGHLSLSLASCRIGSLEPFTNAAKCKPASKEMSPDGSGRALSSPSSKTVSSNRVTLPKRHKHTMHFGHLEFGHRINPGG